jgi:hypothetical protein
MYIHMLSFKTGQTEERIALRLHKTEERIALRLDTMLMPLLKQEHPF